MGFGGIIRQRREARGLTQDKLAAMVGISKPYLSNIETGKVKNPPADPVVKALEQALEVPGGELTKVAHLARTPVDVRQEHDLLEAECHKLRSVLKRLIQGAPRSVDGQIDLEALGRQAARQTQGETIGAGVSMPLINKVAAGYPHQFTDLDYPAAVADEYIRCVDVHDPRAFAVRVVGDCMEPLYRDGDIVVISPNTPVAGGDDCFVRFANGETTFKRYYRDGGETIRLQPLNCKHPAQTFEDHRIADLWPAVLCQRRIRCS